MDVNKPLYVNLNLRRKRSLHFYFFSNDRADFSKLVIVPVFHFGILVDSCFVKNFFCGRGAYTEYVRKAYYSSFMPGKVYSCYACHCLSYVFFIIIVQPWRCLKRGFFLLMT